MNPTPHSCPDDVAFAELFDGVLSPAEQDAFYAGLLGCPDCQDTLALLGALVADEPALLPPAPAGLADRIAARVLPPEQRPVLAARLIDGVWRGIGEAVHDLERLLGEGLRALTPAARPALAVRGAEPDGGLRYEVELAGASVELLLGGLGDRATLTARPLDAPPPRARLVLLRGGEVQASLAFGSDGVTMPALDPGQYLLRLEIPGARPAELPLRLES